jgi:hypothetical protein
MDFINEQNAPVLAAQLLDHLLEAFFKISPVSGSCKKTPQIEGINLAVSKMFGDPTGCNPLSQSFCNSRFANTGFTYMNGIILISAAENLYRSVKNVLSSDQGI